MEYKGYLIFKVEGWYEIDGIAKPFASENEAKLYIDRNGKKDE